MTDRIADLARDERPRERLLAHGAATLADSELVAILLGSGIAGKSAMQLARELLKDGLAALGHSEVPHLSRIPGVGPAKEARIAAALELARRMTTPRTDEAPAFDTDTVGKSLVARYGHQSQERLGAMLLDSRSHVTGRREIYVGTVNSALVSTRDIVHYALLGRSTAVVVHHNHPSGNPTPSAEDLAFTRKLGQALALVDVELEDHIIVGAQRYYSMRQRGML